MQTVGPGVQVAGIVVTVPSGPTDPPLEQDEDPAWQVRGAGQSAAVVHARTLARQVPVVLGGAGGVPHVVPAAQVGVAIGREFITQSKSALGQSRTVVQSTGLGSQTPVTTGVGSGGAASDG